MEGVRAEIAGPWGMCDSLSTPRPLGPLCDDAGNPAVESWAGEHADPGLVSWEQDGPDGR